MINFLFNQGTFGIGLSNKEINLNCVPLSNQPQLEANYCVFTNNAEVEQDGKKIFKMDNIKLELNDVIGVAYDHVELKFFLNNKQLDKVFQGLKGELYPVLYVSDGAILDASFSSFQYELPTGYSKIMIEKSLLWEWF